MADGNRDTRRRFGRRSRSRPASVRQGEPGTDDSPDRQQPLVAMPEMTCSICGKQIFDLSSALAGKDGGSPVHFDCALAQIAEGEHLEAGEKIAYIGRGAFAVVEYRDKSMTAFTVKRRIQWEKEGEKYDWRKSIQQRFGL
ncbi:MAG: hypothetical protein JXM71_06310 [Spirochaetales bacterium]|nr:hypothetical protein [Spirochaetales bacterium]